MTASTLDYRQPETPPPPPRLRLGAVALAVALPCFVLVAIASRAPLEHVDPMVYNAILEALAWAMLAAAAIGFAGLFHHGGRVLAIAAIGLSLGGLMLVPMLIMA